jgi:DNA-binding transcriptional LysR family regulator
LQLEPAVNGLGIAIASLPLIQNDLAAGRLTCPIEKPELSTQDYLLVSEYRQEDAAVRASRSWITGAAHGQDQQKRR